MSKRPNPKKKKKSKQPYQSKGKPPPMKSFRPTRNIKFNEEEGEKKELGAPDEEEVGMRLNKFIAHCGICSRRAADELIKGALVKVNGTIIKEPGHRVLPTDKVRYDGKVLATVRRKIYVLMNKPRNTITTTKDERGRKTVLDVIGDKVKERIYPVGRLDRETTGLLLLTNDGDLAKKLSHPSHKVQKIYHVFLNKDVKDADIKKIKKGLTLEDGLVEVDAVSHVEGAGKNEVGIEIHLGKNRIVRRIFEHLGYDVVKLDRVYYGGLTKKNLPRGWFRHLNKQEVIMLKHFK